jgi:hypothetical protein
MKKIAVILIVVTLSWGACTPKSERMDELIEYGLDRAIEQYLQMASTLEEGRYPRSVDKTGQLVTLNKNWWCSGFFPGSLWYLYEYSGNNHLRKLAEQYTEELDSIKYVTNDHDVGFQLFCSYGNGFRLTDNQDYQKVLITGAYSLSTRFNSKVGAIRSWDWNREVWQYPVIIDNMMNLELLMWAGKETKDVKLLQIAEEHANTTLKNHFRENFSTYHLVDYDSSNGKVRKKQTVQGLNNESSWARGQSWALYGYTMMARETSKSHYLEQATHIADFLMNHPHMPEDKVPYRDYDDPKIPNVPRDASAAAIMASALLELSRLVTGDISMDYYTFACQQLQALSSPQYLAETGTNSNFILKHSTGNLPGNEEVDVPLSYADYYYIEALMRLNKYLNENK